MPDAFKTAFVQITSFLVLVVLAFIVYLVVASKLAESKAEKACNLIKLGSSAQEVELTFTSIESDARLKHKSSEFAAIGFHGAIIDRWLCHVSFRDGKVVSKEVNLVD